MSYAEEGATEGAEEGTTRKEAGKRATRELRDDIVVLQRTPSFINNSVRNSKELTTKQHQKELVTIGTQQRRAQDVVALYSIAMILLYCSYCSKSILFYGAA